MGKFLYFILLPFSLLYGSILHLRSKCYDWKLFHTVKFNFPVIVVGNLNVGGVGKTPHIEYLIRLLSNTQKIATLNRGYKRKTTGFILANNNSSIFDIGDEPLQYSKKFEKITVAVDEKRVRGIQLLKKKFPDLETILLDDAFQHRSVNTDMNILITDFNHLYIYDTVLPSGRLREWKSGAKRAQIIIVSKCNPNISNKEKETIIRQINPLAHQKIYFSAIQHGDLTPFNSAAKKISFSIPNNYSTLIITGIANPTPFLALINSQFNTVKHLHFSDHHQFNKIDIQNIKKEFSHLKNDNKIIITTEKDLMRLSLPEILTELENIPLFYIPIEIYFLGNDKVNFDCQIQKYVNTK